VNPYRDTTTHPNNHSLAPHTAPKTSRLHIYATAIRCWLAIVWARLPFVDGPQYPQRTPWFRWEARWYRNLRWEDYKQDIKDGLLGEPAAQRARGAWPNSPPKKAPPPMRYSE
jgi:hypothetical protein